MDSHAVTLVCQTNRSRKTLNAIAPHPPHEADDRTTRHLAMCAELADLAMQLARATAARALADQAAPEAPPSTQPLEPAPASGPAAHPARATAPRATLSCPRQIDPALLFTRLAAVVRDCITLEARLAAGLAPTRGTRPRACLPADPRRDLLREILRRAIEHHPARAALNREIPARLEQHLEADPDQTLHPTEILEKICDEFQIEPDWANLPDEYLDAICEGLEEPGEETPDPRATSPP
jgi:hypothetical protein